MPRLHILPPPRRRDSALFPCRNMYLTQPRHRQYHRHGRQRGRRPRTPGIHGHTRRHAHHRRRSQRHFLPRPCARRQPPRLRSRRRRQPRRIPCRGAVSCPGPCPQTRPPPPQSLTPLHIGLAHALRRNPPLHRAPPTPRHACLRPCFRVEPQAIYRRRPRAPLLIHTAHRGRGAHIGASPRGRHISGYGRLHAPDGSLRGRNPRSRNVPHRNPKPA